MRDRPSRPGRQPGRSRPGGAATAATRPAARRTSANGPGTTTRTSGTMGGRFTARAVVLGVVLVALGLSYVFPLRVYLAQQAEIAELRAAQAEQRAHVAELESTAALWEDDDYIRIQARQRLYFGEPGEVLLLVTPPGEDEPPATGFDPDDVPPPATPWWDTLWASVRSADRAGGSAPDADGPERSG